jgi:hypothetical protein
LNMARIASVDDCDNLIDRIGDAEFALLGGT